MLQAGKLRHRVTLQQQVAGSPQRTASGQRDVAWTDVATVWASIEPLSGRRLESAQATWPKVSVEIRIRYRAGVVAGMRAVHSGLYYPIEVALDPELRRIELRLMCSQGAAVG
jgi:SPP1 family predicted phage head-tail adaptor